MKNKKLIRTKNEEFTKEELTKFLDNLGFSLFDLASILQEDKKSLLAKELIRAAVHIACCCNILERQKRKFNFNEKTKIWLECQLESQEN